MKEIMNKWRNYKKQILLNEVNSSEYFTNVNLIKQYISDKENFPLTRYKELVDAARIIISDRNSRYWKDAGQYGTPAQLKSTEPDSVWTTSIELAGKNAEAERTLPSSTKLQTDIRDFWKVNIPFLDPSSIPGLHPWWRKKGGWLFTTGGILQTTFDTLLDAESVAFIILGLFTGGLATVAGKYKVISPALIEAFNYINKVMKLNSTTAKGRGLSAFQEIEKICRATLNKIISSPQANKIVLDSGTKVVKYETLLKPMAENAGSAVVSNFVHWIQSEVVPVFINDIQFIMTKYPVNLLAVPEVDI